MQIKYKPCVATPFAASGFYLARRKMLARQNPIRRVVIPVYRASYRPVYFPAKRMVPVLDSVIR